jgi:uncharacterized peroxidase-related enzyme
LAFRQSERNNLKAHIQVPEGAPGILGPMATSPQSTGAFRELAEVLLRGPNTLTPGEREMIATYASAQNDCCFCQLSHGAAAAEHLNGDYDLIDRLKRNYATAEISDKLKSLLAIAGKVQKGGKQVTPEDVARARRQGASDKEIHDTVLIAAAFCMFNRYVDGMDTWRPTDPTAYPEMGQTMAQVGYVKPHWEKPGEAAWLRQIGESATFKCRNARDLHGFRSLSLSLPISLPIWSRIPLEADGLALLVQKASDRSR